MEDTLRRWSVGLNTVRANLEFQRRPRISADNVLERPIREEPAPRFDTMAAPFENVEEDNMGMNETGAQSMHTHGDWTQGRPPITSHGKHLNGSLTNTNPVQYQGGYSNVNQYDIYQQQPQAIQGPASPIPNGRHHPQDHHFGYVDPRYNNSGSGGYHQGPDLEAQNQGFTVRPNGIPYNAPANWPAEESPGLNHTQRAHTFQVIETSAPRYSPSAVQSSGTGETNPGGFNGGHAHGGSPFDDIYNSAGAQAERDTRSRSPGPLNSTGTW